MPQPARLKAPVGAPAQEAAVVWHELLAARHLLPGKRPVTSDDSPRRAFVQPQNLEAAAGSLRIGDIRPTAERVPAPAATNMTAWLGGGVSGAAVLVALSAGGLVVRRRRRVQN
jgi:hypothetical protein